MKDGDAKLQGLKLRFCDYVSQIPNTNSCDLCEEKGGYNVLKQGLKLKYRFHLLLQKYNEALMEDAICKELRARLQQKAVYHRRQASFIEVKM